MILVVDSGSSKADWRLIEDDGVVFGFQTIGLSPFFVDAERVFQTVESSFPGDKDAASVDKIYFYGAGCSSDDRKKIIIDGLKMYFKSCTIFVETDMYGTAKALFGNDPGIAAILGTGSNTCLWDGSRIVKGSPSLGYVLGDEGSGAHLGISLVKLYLNHELPPNLSKQFEEKYNVNRNVILDNVYRKPQPNKYLANFTGFLVEHKSNPFIIFTVTSCFLDFFGKQVKIYPSYAEYKIRFIGSVAYYFSDVLHECALASEMSIDKIVQHPVDDLVKCILEDERGTE